MPAIARMARSYTRCSGVASVWGWPIADGVRSYAGTGVG